MLLAICHKIKIQGDDWFHSAWNLLKTTLELIGLHFSDSNTHHTIANVPGFQKVFCLFNSYYRSPELQGYGQCNEKWNVIIGGNLAWEQKSNYFQPDNYSWSLFPESPSRYKEKIVSLKCIFLYKQHLKLFKTYNTATFVHFFPGL